MEDHRGDVIHLIPIGDTIAHEPDQHCVCGPARDVTRRPDGCVVLEVHHHRLDGKP